MELNNIGPILVSKNLHNSSIDIQKYGLLTGFASLLSTFLIFTLMSPNSSSRNKDLKGRSTRLPGYGLLGDRVNELIGIFLDALAIYVHNDRSWDCQRRLLCEASQRTVDSNWVHGILTYGTSLLVAFLLRGQRVSESIEAMRRGRKRMDCNEFYPQCPFSL